MIADVFGWFRRARTIPVNASDVATFKGSLFGQAALVMCWNLTLFSFLTVVTSVCCARATAQEAILHKEAEQKLISVAEKELLSWGRSKDPKFDSLFKFEFFQKTNSVFVNSGHPWVGVSNTFYFDEQSKITGVRLGDGSYERIKENVFVKKEKGLVHVHMSFENDVWCGEWIVNDEDNQLVFRGLTKAELTPKGRSIFAFAVKPEHAQNSRMLFRRNDSGQHFFLVVNDFLKD